MKKIVTAVFALMLAVSMTACKSDKENKGAEIEETTVTTVEVPEEETPAGTEQTSSEKEETADENKFSARLKKNMDMAASDKIYIEATSTIKDKDGIQHITKTVTARDGDKLYMDITLFGYPVIIIQNDEGAFMLNRDEKSYIKTDKNQVPENQQEYSENIKLVKTEDNCEEYTDEESKYKYYFDENDCLIKQEVFMADSAVLTEYSAFTTDIPDGIFEIPEGYTEIKK